jgi:serine/tyrosine/threonine adenylyltransferase
MPSLTTNNIAFNWNNSYTLLPAALFKPAVPASVPAPELLLYNHQLAATMGLHTTDTPKEELAQLFCGNQLPNGALPIAQAYAGHQFGYFNMLGDGRAILLGEHLTTAGKRLDVQLKGSGQTAYSRRGDGKATLYSMLREYLISEAMYHLGVPTGRSLAVVSTGEQVVRQQLHQGAVLTRIAASHIRVGTFEYVSRFHTPLLKTFTQYVVERHFPEIAEAPNLALALLQAVMEKQVSLICHWMRVGFIHGVMNTDNMFVSGETLDYGPCAFMNTYNPGTVFSAIDEQGRYAFGNQPTVAQWNLAVLASALLPLIHEQEDKAIAAAQEIINQYPALYQQQWLSMMRSKLGLASEKPEDDTLVQELLLWMETNAADYTNTFFQLSQGSFPAGEAYENDAFKKWHQAWQIRKNKDALPAAESFALMQQNNPAFVPRNHLVEAALEGITLYNNYDVFNSLLQVLRQPYQYQPVFAGYQHVPANTDMGYQTFCGT